MAPRFVPPVRWRVWWFEEEVWSALADSMPQGAAYSYADTQRRYAGAVVMEAGRVVDEDEWVAWIRFIDELQLPSEFSMQLVYAALSSRPH